jgi:hypothetical protein
MAMENFTIVQHQNTFWYAIIQGGGYWPQVYKFELGDYVYLQWTTLITLNVITKHVIMCVQKVLHIWFVVVRPW